MTPEELEYEDQFDLSYSPHTFSERRANASFFEESDWNGWPVVVGD